MPKVRGALNGGAEVVGDGLVTEAYAKQRQFGQLLDALQGQAGVLGAAGAWPQHDPRGVGLQERLQLAGLRALHANLDP